MAKDNSAPQTNKNVLKRATDKVRKPLHLAPTPEPSKPLPLAHMDSNGTWWFPASVLSQTVDGVPKIARLGEMPPVRPVDKELPPLPPVQQKLRFSEEVEVIPRVGDFEGVRRRVEPPAMQGRYYKLPDRPGSAGRRVSDAKNERAAGAETPNRPGGEPSQLPMDQHTLNVVDYLGRIQQGRTHGLPIPPEHDADGWPHTHLATKPRWGQVQSHRPEIVEQAEEHHSAAGEIFGGPARSAHPRSMRK